MTNTLLIIIAVLLLVRIVLQVRLGKRGFDKWYCAPCEVENISVQVNAESATSTMEYYGKQGYELVQVIFPYGYKTRTTIFFFTRKKIKNYYEEA